MDGDLFDFDVGDDSDMDGIPDVIEEAIGADPFDPDSDDDGVPDGLDDSVFSEGGLVVDGDVDDGGFFDSDDDLFDTGDDLSGTEEGFDMRDVMVDDAGVPDAPPYDFSSFEDTDNDGLTDAMEHELGTDPDDPDSDNDGVTDFNETAHGTDPLDGTDRIGDTIPWQPAQAPGPLGFVGDVVGGLQGALGDLPVFGSLSDLAAHILEHPTDIAGHIGKSVDWVKDHPREALRLYQEVFGEES